MSRTPGAVLYARVSTGEQAQHGTSMDSQREACRQKALSLSLPIVAEYEDAGVSGGFLLTRQGMQSALADIQAGRADTLICANLSRFSRDAGHQQEIKKAVRQAGGRLVFCDMNFDDTPEGDLAFGIMGGFAEYEKAVIKKRTYGGRVRLAEAGIQTSRVFSPFGYHIVGTADVLRGLYPAAERGTYQVIETEAVVVREMFTRYASGAASLVGLAHWLTEQNIPTRARAAFWRPNAVRYILSNPVYKGLAAFGKVDHALDETRIGQPNPLTGKPMKTRRVCRAADPETWIIWPVPALVSEDLWERVQAKFGQNQSQYGGNPKRVRVLAGRVFCLHCGAPMHVLHTPKRVEPHKDNYLCSTYRKKFENTKEQGCLPTYYPVSIMEEAVTLAFLDAARRPQSVLDALALYQSTEEAEGTPGEDVAGKKARIARDRAALDARQQATVKAQIAGIMAGADAAAYASVFGEIAKARAALDAEESRLPCPALPRAKAYHTPRTEADTVAVALEDMARVLRSPDVPDATKRKLVGRVVAAVYPIEDRKPYQREGGWGARVEFLPGALGGLEAEAVYMSQTFQTSGKKCCLNFMVA